MAKVHQKLIRTLRTKFKDVEDHLEDLPGGRVSGILVSSAFEQLDHGDRQKKVWTILKRSLSTKEFQLVGAIALLTPAELNVKAI